MSGRKKELFKAESREWNIQVANGAIAIKLFLLLHTHIPSFRPGAQHVVFCIAVFPFHTHSMLSLSLTLASECVRMFPSFSVLPQKSISVGAAFHFYCAVMQFSFTHSMFPVSIESTLELLCMTQSHKIDCLLVSLGCRDNENKFCNRIKHSRVTFLLTSYLGLIFGHYFTCTYTCHAFLLRRKLIKIIYFLYNSEDVWNFRVDSGWRNFAFSTYAYKRHIKSEQRRASPKSGMKNTWCNGYAI